MEHIKLMNVITDSKKSDMGKKHGYIGKSQKKSCRFRN